jgi:hypothetical protein
MNQTNTVMLALVIALGAVLVAGGLIATIPIPASAKISSICVEYDIQNNCTHIENQNPAGAAPPGQNR